MRKVHTLLAVSLCAVSVIVLIPSARGDDERARQELEAIYARVCQGFKAKDSRDLQRFLEKETTSDLTYRTPQGTITRQQLADRLKNQPWNPSSKGEIQVIEVTIMGSEAEVLASSRFEGILHDPRLTGDASGGEHRLVETATGRDTWVRTADGWKLRMHETLRSKTTLDGKPFTPPAPPRLAPRRDPGRRAG